MSDNTATMAPHQRNGTHQRKKSKQQRKTGLRRRKKMKTTSAKSSSLDINSHTARTTAAVQMVLKRELTTS